MIRDTFVQQKLVAALSGGFAALAAILTMVGLYGLVAYTVSRRTPEIGLRMALGATAANVVSLLLRETGVLLLIGIACGIALSLAGGPTAGALLFGIEPYDPGTLGAAVGLLAGIAVVASFVPARRATRIEPTVALRTE
jgi:ABC-type antimicrobial peptide transport system permease subunit